MSISIKHNELQISGNGNTLTLAISDYKAQVVRERVLIKQRVDKDIREEEYLGILQKEIDSWGK